MQMKLALRLSCSLFFFTSFAFAGVWVSSPTNHSTVGSTVQYVAKAATSCAKGVAAMAIYTAPGQLAYKVAGAHLNTLLTFNPGTYDTVVQEWDYCGSSSYVHVKIFVPLTAKTIPHSQHVWLITEENHSYENVIGNASMPYYNYLAHKYALATQYYSDRHSSLPALMRLVAGQIVTTNNNTTAC
jgi:hypothetical protein